MSDQKEQETEALAKAAGSIATMLDYANILKRLPRTGWLIAGVGKAESIADHSLGTSLLALALVDSINLNPAAQGLAAPLNAERVIRIALLHDLAESIVTDLPKRATEAIGEPEKHAAESRAWQAITTEVPLAADWFSLWQEYVEATTPEAKLVHDADKLEMAHQALCYTAAGVQFLDDFWSDRAWAYPISREVRHLLLRRQNVDAA